MPLQFPQAPQQSAEVLKKALEFYRFPKQTKALKPFPIFTANLNDLDKEQILNFKHHVAWLYLLTFEDKITHTLELEVHKNNILKIGNVSTAHAEEYGETLDVLSKSDVLKNPSANYTLQAVREILTGITALWLLDNTDAKKDKYVAVAPMSLPFVANQIMEAKEFLQLSFDLLVKRLKTDDRPKKKG